MYHKTILGNGVRIISERLPVSRVVSVGIWIDVGSRDEHDLNNGCAHFVEHMFFKGTRTRTAQQIAKEFDVLGGAANAFTTRESTCFYATVIDSKLENLLDLFSDMLLYSNFDSEEINRERQVILQEINMVEDVPDDHIHDLFSAQLWGRHSLGKTILGSREVIGSLDSKKLTDYIERLYTPDRILIAAAGNIDHEELVRYWDRALRDLRRPCAAGTSRQAPKELPAVQTVYPKDLEQVHLLLGTYGLSSIDDGRYALLLFNVLLGGNMSSRLFQEIREKRGLAYSIYSYLVPYIDSGYLAIYLGVDRERVNESMALIFRELHSLVNGQVTASALADAKDFIKAGLYLADENMESIMTRIARNESTFDRYISLEEIAGAVDQVTPADIESIGQRLFNNRKLTMTALGPLEASEVDNQPLL